MPARHPVQHDTNWSGFVEAEGSACRNRLATIRRVSGLKSTVTFSNRIPWAKRPNLPLSRLSATHVHTPGAGRVTVVPGPSPDLRQWTVDRRDGVDRLLCQGTFRLRDFVSYRCPVRLGVFRSGRWHNQRWTRGNCKSFFCRWVVVARKGMVVGTVPCVYTTQPQSYPGCRYGDGRPE